MAFNFRLGSAVRETGLLGSLYHPSYALEGLKIYPLANYTVALLGEEAGAIGDQCTSYTGAYTIGTRCLARDYGLAVGNFCTAGEDAIAIGNDCTADVLGGIALGYGCLALGVDGVAFGQRCKAYEGGVAAGYESEAQRNSVAIGYQCLAEPSGDTGGIAIGKACVAGPGAIALGIEVKATGDFSGCVGSNLVNDADSTWLFGHTSKYAAFGVSSSRLTGRVAANAIQSFNASVTLPTYKLDDICTFCTAAGDTTALTPTAADMVAQRQFAQTGDSWIWYLVNQGGGNCTLSANTGVTLDAHGAAAGLVTATGTTSVWHVKIMGALLVTITRINTVPI
jgi:hypothetical protein